MLCNQIDTSPTQNFPPHQRQHQEMQKQMNRCFFKVIIEDTIERTPVNQIT